MIMIRSLLGVFAGKKINGNKLRLNIHVNFIQNFFRIYNVALGAMNNIYSVFFFHNTTRWNLWKKEFRQVSTMYVYTKEYENH